tara:strand:+ start:3541 stop:3771 length:231 start_codon:yes stop_codon:yes gene_type:complete
MRVRVPPQVPFIKESKMKYIINLLMIAAASWFSFDWATDNPLKAKYARKQAEKTFEQVYQTVSEHVENMQGGTGQP